MSSVEEVDVLVGGAGYSGLYALHSLRKAGLKVKCVERSSGIGGVWHANRYPGARVDIPATVYQHSDPDIWTKWEWTEKFPAQAEIIRYFAFLDSKRNLSKDVILNCEIVEAQFNIAENKWIVKCSDGRVWRCRWFIAAFGFGTEKYVPAFSGAERFKGQLFHTSDWPSQGLSLKGKRVGVIGTGPSGVQVIQELGPVVERLTVYQRTPNLALPMKQELWPSGNEDADKSNGTYQKRFKFALSTFAAIGYDFVDKVFAEASSEESREFWEQLWAKGGFWFWLGNYKDLLFNETTNQAAYAFWAEKTRERIKDQRKKDLLAPLVAPHPFGTKLPSLEQSFYETFNQANVDIVDISTYPILEITETGIRTAAGEVELDVIIYATGFDAHTGALTKVNLKGTDGLTLKERWAKGARCHLGLGIAHYPNFFYMYAFQAPTAFAVGPMCAGVRGDWIVQTILDMTNNGVVRLEPKSENQEEWNGKVNFQWENSLFLKAKSFYLGVNIPGKVYQPLNWCGGIPAYIKELEKCREEGYSGFVQFKA